MPQVEQPVDGAPVWVKVEIERAPDSAGSPGLWANIATVIISLSGPVAYAYEDTFATVGDWYRHRFTNVAVDAWSNYSVPVQTNSFLALQWIEGDITDADIDEDDWATWGDQSITDMWTQGVWLRKRLPIIPYDADADGYIDERYNIPAELFEVCRVERVFQNATKAITAATNATPIVVTSAAHGFANGDLVYIVGALGNLGANGSWVINSVTTDTFTLQDSVGSGVWTSGGTVRKAGTRHASWRFIDVEWQQEDREIRLLDLAYRGISAATPTLPSTPQPSFYDYVLHGKQRIRDITELREEHYMLFYWLMRQKYLDFRIAERTNRMRFIVFNDQDDVTERFLPIMKARADQEVATRLAKLLPEQYASDIAPANMAELS